MKRYVFIATLLGVVYLVVRSLVGAFVFHRVDLRFLAFLQVLVVPAFQAAVLVLVARDSRGASLPSTARAVASSRVAIALLAIEGVFLAGIATGFFPPATAALHGVMAAALLLAVAASWPDRRVFLALFAIGLAAIAMDRALPWLAVLPRLVGRYPPFIRDVIVYIPLFGLGLALALRLAAVARERSAAAARLFETAIAFALGAATIIAAGFFSRPWLQEPWKTVEFVFSYLCVTSILLGAALLRWPEEAAA